MKIPRTLYRSVSLERAGINEEERTIELSISSEEPYRRSFGHEILDHSPNSVDMTKIMDGAPLLWNHDPDKHLGTIIDARIQGGKLRVIAKIGENSDAEERWKDIKSGVLKKASVGYHITGMKKEGKGKDDAPIYRCEWQPHEATLTPLPADSTVGIGRAEELCGEVDMEPAGEEIIRINAKSGLDEPLKSENKRVMSEPAVVQEPKINVVEERNAAVAAERKRVQDITELSRHFASNGLAGRKIDTTEVAEQFVREGKTVEDFQNAVVRGSFKEVVPVETAPTIGMERKDLAKYSLVRAMNCLASKRPLDGFEKECSEAAAKILRKDTSGFFIPHDVMSQGQERALTTNVFSAAGALVGTNLMAGSMIDLLRNNMVVVAMGARTMSGLQGNIAIPKQTGGATAYWLSEDGTVTTSNATVGQVSMTPHRLAARTAFTLQLLAQSSVDVENFVREDLMKVLALKKDAAALVGTGSAGEPLGITQLPAAQLSTPVTLANAGTITFAEAVRFETNVANSNALIGSPGFVTTPTVKGGTKVTPKFTNTGFPVWDNDTVNGYRAVATLQNTATNTVIFGDWSSIVIGDWAGTEVLVDPYTLGAQGQVQIIIQQLTDIICRQPKSFALSSN